MDGAGGGRNFPAGPGPLPAAGVRGGFLGGEGAASPETCPPPPPSRRRSRAPAACPASPGPPSRGSAVARGGSCAQRAWAAPGNARGLRLRAQPAPGLAFLRAAFPRPKASPEPHHTPPQVPDLPRPQPRSSLGLALPGLTGLAAASSGPKPLPAVTMFKSKKKNHQKPKQPCALSSAIPQPEQEADLAAVPSHFIHSYSGEFSP